MNKKLETVCTVRSPCRVNMPKNHNSVKDQMIAYPGWRWRFENGMYYHEKIPNPILRLWDRLTRRIS
jgi:hypothetical protein